METAWYFAYGSNMQTATFCGRRAIRFQRALPGRAAGWRLVFDKPPVFPIGESYANIVSAADAEVLGVLYEISARDLDHIDLTEGVLLGNYRRIEIPVQPLSEQGATHPAFTLVSDRRVAGLQPSTRYMQLLIDGALEHGLPGDYVAFLRAVPARPESRRAALLRPLLDEFMRRR
jgi:cation transport regulator ChaC